MTSRAGGCSPAPGAPLRETGSLRADRRVVAVAGVEPGLVGQPLEDLGLDLVDELDERRLVAERVADPAREERVAREEMGVAGRVVVQQGDRAGRVAGE